MTCKFIKPTSTKPCSHYIKTGSCSRPDYFRCVEYISKFEPILSYSGVNNFIKCPRLYYLAQIKGIQLKEQYQSDALKIGKMVDEWITTKDHDNDPDSESLFLMKSQAMFETFSKVIKINIDDYIGQQEFIYQEDGRPQARGFIDLSAKDISHFIELKCTTKPDYYTNPYWIHDQLGTYFLSNPNYQYGIIWAIRTPGLKQTGNFKDESLEDYKDRCIRDMLKRPTYYFTGYKKDTQTFGVKFYRSEFDLEGLKARYKWIGHQIQDCVEEDYWYQNRTQCINPWQCDMLNICNSGGISEDVYERREKK